MSRWSLRTKLVAVTALAFLPVVAISGWRAFDDARQAQVHHAEAASAVSGLAESRYRELMEGSRRLLVAACTDDAVQRVLEPAATPEDVQRCETYLSQLLQKFPSDYSAVVVDDRGIARCGSTPTARGMNFSDREIFRLVQQSRAPAVGANVASRLTQQTAIPIGVPVVRDGQFSGMCGLGLSMRSLAEQVGSPQSAGSAGVALVDRAGGLLGGDTRATSALPVASRIAAMIASRQASFADYGQNGATYDFHVRPLVGEWLYAIAAIPADRSFTALLLDWGEFALILLAMLVAMTAIWLPADLLVRARPLRYIQDFAGRVARGESVTLAPFQPWTPEMVSVGARVSEMAAAIASREQELKAELEQRDHMLREIHHRVKNNLQMISSLLNLQAGEIRSPRIRRFFGDAQNRVLTLSILHRHLYERSSWSLVDFQQFISDLVRQISVARPGIERPTPRYQIRAPIMAVGPDTAIPVGLIVTEAVGRALNHDFSGVAVPEIRIEAVEKEDGEAELVIEDNGVETSRAVVGNSARGSFGLTLMSGLAMQLGGEAKISPREGGGTRVVVTFPLPRDEAGHGRMRTARSIGLVVGLTIAVLVATGAALTFVHYNSAAKQQRLVSNNYETISLMRQALIVLQDAEIGQRAYLLTGDIANLEPYERARLRFDPIVRQLEAASADDSGALGQISEFRSATTEKLGELNATIVAYQLYGRDATLPRNAGRSSSDHIRQVADAFIEGQTLLLSSRLAALRSEQEQADVAGLLVLGGAFVCLIVGMFLIVRGNSRLETAQAELSARSRLLQSTLETLHDPIFVLDAAGSVVAWNEAFAGLASWTPARQAPPTRDQLLSERFPATRALLQPLRLAEPQKQTQATARVSYEGRDYEVSRGEMSGGGAVVRCVDVTEKLRDDAALRQGQKMEAVGQLTGGMAHDFNNILQVIQANLDLIKTGVENSPETLGRLHSASAAADRGARLTQQLLAFARRQPLAPQPTSIARLAADLGELLRHALGERVVLDFAIARDAWSARIDPSQLENAILNLALNARDAMPDGGTVRIEVSNATLDRRYAALHPEVTPGAYVLVAVADTGTGMPADVVAHAFDPFFTTKLEGRGTGLGLSMVYGFVRQSNGHIRIDSAIGQGTSVKLYLPRTLDPVLQSEPEAAHPASGNERILVVEDNDEVRRAVVDMLEGWGYRVVAVENPDLAAGVLGKDPAFDLLFTDIVMPGVISAVQLTKIAQERRPGIGVLLTSGYARDLIPKHDGPEFPMIVKPYRSDELAGRVRAVLAARRRPAAAVAAERTPTMSPSRMDHPRRVLFVEDEVVLRMSTVDMLERLGCVVAAVGSGEQALEILDRSRDFDLLLTDLGLPGMTGEQLAAEVLRRFPNLPVIIASGYGKSNADPAGLRFIGKPYSSIDLQQALDEVARKASAS